jgi:DNA-binding NarL/FixJ family response regulator
MSTIRVILAEDHTIVRAGIRSLLDALEGVQVVAEASDGREALQLIETHQPDVVVMDIAMPGLNGLETAARVAKEFPRVRLIMLSMHASQEFVAQALRAGAAAYLIKDAAVGELELALKAVTRGETYLCSAISKHVVEGYLGRADGEPSPFEELTARQREILQLIAEGHSTKDIAHILNVSVKTVEAHRAGLMARLDLHDIAGLVRYAIRVGLVHPEK